MLLDVIVFVRWKKPISRFSVSPSMHNRIFSEWRYLKTERTPEALLRFPSWKRRKCFCIRAELVTASRDIQNYAASLTEDVMPGQIPWAGIVQLTAQRKITRKLTVLDFTEGFLALLSSWHPFPPSSPFPWKTDLSLKLDSLWGGYSSDK